MNQSNQKFDVVWHSRISRTLKKLKKSTAQMTVALVMAAIIAVPSVSALTSSDVELLIALGIIPADKAAVARAAVSGNSNTVSCGVFMRDLTLGSTGSDVVSLQTFLESKGKLTMPVGVSKGYFGQLTRQALASYQASVGIAPAVGYFGPITRSNVALACAPGNPNPGTPNNPNPELSNKEARLSDYDRENSYSNETLEEGETAKVFAAEFSVEDGDVKIDRVDIALEAVSETNEDEPWKQIESITLFINGDEVDSMDVDSEDDWSRESSTETPTTSRAYEVRFAGLDTVVEEGDDALIEIEIKTSDRIDDNDLTQSWKIWIPTDGIRAVDGKGIDHYEGSNSESTEFEIETADDGDVSIRSSDDDLDASILVVDTDTKSSSYEVFRFEVEADDADIFLNTLTIVASTSDNNINDVVSELTVEIDGDEFDFDSVSTTANVGEYLFDFEDNNDDVGVDKDDTVEVVVFVRFHKNTGNYADGTTVQFGIGKIDGSDYGDIGITAEGQSTGDNADVTGRQEGSLHTLRTEGISTTSTGNTFTYRDNLTGTLSDDEGIYKFQIRVTALEEDAWIDNSVATTSSTTAGFVATVTGDTFNGESSARIADTTADVLTNNRYKISEGTSETFEIVVELDPATAGAYGLTLSNINFAISSNGTQVEYVVPNETQYRISSKTIKN
ncbi:MAG: peptidoglycan-binding protein [Candidatus Paceibacterota bacterium]